MTGGIGAVLAQVQLDDAGAGTLAGLWLSRAANYLTLTLVVGFLVLAVVLLADKGERLGGTAALACRRAGLLAGLWALSVAALFTYGMSNAAARPLPEALQPAIATQFAGTRLGTALLAQGAIAVIVAVLAFMARTPAAAAAGLAAVAAGSFAPVWWGHAGTADPRVVALASDWAHVLAVTVWMGGLAALTWLALRQRETPLQPPLRRFSAIAGWALGIVLATGAVNALLGMSSPGQLLGTTWGRLVLVKLLLLAALGALGVRQRRRVLPRATAEGTGTRRVFRTIALAELGLMVIGIGVASSMASGIPAEAEAAARIQSVFTAFADGQINATVDPATAGSNYLHLYFLDDRGQQRPDVTEPEVQFEMDGQVVQAQLFPAGTGHWSAPSVTLPEAGQWRITVSALVAGEPASASSAITVR